MRQVVPIDFKRDNSALILKIRKQLEQKLHASQRVGLLRELGHWYRNMGQFEDARHPLEESLSLDRDNGYHTIKELLPVLVKLGDRSRAKEVMNDLLRLDPHNPTVFNDCFTFARGWIERNELLTIIDTLKAEYPDDRFVQANCDFYAGNLLISDDPASARKRLIAARQTFRYLYPNKHQVFRELSIALKLCPEDDR